MAEKILAWLGSFIVGTIAALGYPGIALLMAIQSACIPLPSEIIMPFSGYLVSTGQFSLFWVATVATIGSNIGSHLAYWAGATSGRTLVERYGKYVLVGVDELDKAERFFTRYGNAAVLIGRLLPVIRSFVSFPAGIARMPLVKFHIYSFIGSWPWCFALAWLGMKLGAAWNTDPRVKSFFHQADLVILIALVAGGGWFVWHRLKADKTI